MTKVKVLSTFVDKHTGKYHYPGDIIEIEDERANELQDKGLVDKIKGKGAKGYKRPPKNKMIEEAENK